MVNYDLRAEEKQQFSWHDTFNFLGYEFWHHRRRPNWNVQIAKKMNVAGAASAMAGKADK